MKTHSKNFIIDSHCHLNYPGLIEAIDDVINSCQKLDNNFYVKILQTVCTQHSDIPIIIDIIRKYSNVFGSVGLHPNNVIDLNEMKASHQQMMSLDCLLSYANDPKIIGIGETGLDYFKKDNVNSSMFKPQQQESFLTHILAAQKTRLGLIVHSREAESDTYEILKQEMNSRPFNVVLHCFTGSLEFAKRLLDIGCFISFSGIITFKNAASIQEVVKFVPLDRILIETDSPYLAPAPYRGKVNQPAYVYYVADAVANIKKINLEEVAEKTNRNFLQVFNESNKIDIDSIS